MTKKIIFLRNLFLLFLFVFSSNILFGQDQVLDASEQSMVTNRRNQQEELQKLMRLLKIRYDDKNKAGELENRIDCVEIEKTIQKEIDWLIARINELKMELTEEEFAAIANDDDEIPGWLRYMSITSGIFLVTTLMLASYDPFEGLVFPPSFAQIDQNIQRITGALS